MYESTRALHNHVIAGRGREAATGVIRGRIAGEGPLTGA